jgi:SAM-dependent methyltransferase
MKQLERIDQGVGNASLLPKRLNLGCGYDRRDGWLNVDCFEECSPDLVIDLERFPWQLPSNHFDHVLLKHVLEHLGSDFDILASVLRELYRVTRADALVEIYVPHHRHDNFWSDPTHVRAFTPLTFQMLSRKECDDWVRRKVGNTLLAHRIGVDFDIVNIAYMYDPKWLKKQKDGELTMSELREIAQTHWGVIRELRVNLKVVK